jgi:hypothetical protein
MVCVLASSGGAAAGEWNAGGSVRTDEDCLPKLVCKVKNRIRWRTPAWDETTCQSVATAIQEAAERHDLHPHLILGTLVNESELDEKAHRDTYIGGHLYAKDGGLGGVRCVLGQDGKTCTNFLVRGVTWKKLMEPATNIEVTAQILAYFRDGGATTRKIVQTTDRRGRQRAVYRAVPCQHKTHAWWAHYNHGPAFIDRGPARHYPHRVAVLYAALLRAAGEPMTTELGGTITMTDKGQKPRTLDRPVGDRQRRLVAHIMESQDACRAIASATMRRHAGAPEAARVCLASRGHAVDRSRRALP